MRQRSFPKLALVNLMMMLLLGNENFIFRATVAEEHSSLLQKGSSLQGGNTRKSSHDALDTIFAKGGLGNKRNLRTKSDQNDQNLSLDSMEENEMRVAVTNEFEELFLLLVYVCEAGGQTFTYKVSAMIFVSYAIVYRKNMVITIERAVNAILLACEYSCE